MVRVVVMRDGFLERKEVDRRRRRGGEAVVRVCARGEAPRLFGVVERAEGVREGRVRCAFGLLVFVELSTFIGEENEEAGLRNDEERRQSSMLSMCREEERRTRRLAALICETPQNVNGSPTNLHPQAVAANGHTIIGSSETTKRNSPERKAISFRGSCELPARSRRNVVKDVEREDRLSRIRSAKAEGGRNGSTEGSLACASARRVTSSASRRRVESLRFSSSGFAGSMKSIARWYAWERTAIWSGVRSAGLAAA